MTDLTRIEDDSLLSSLVDATQVTLSMMGLEVEPESTFARDTWTTWGEFSAVYDLSSSDCDAVFIMSFDEPGARAALTTILGSGTDFVEADAIDLTSEFINQIVGAMKSVLADEGIAVPMVQPISYHGVNREVIDKSPQSRSAVLFRCGDGAFVVEALCRKHP